MDHMHSYEDTHSYSIHISSELTIKFVSLSADAILSYKIHDTSSVLI